MRRLIGLCLAALLVAGLATGMAQGAPVESRALHHILDGRKWSIVERSLELVLRGGAQTANAPQPQSHGRRPCDLRLRSVARSSVWTSLLG